MGFLIAGFQDLSLTDGATIARRLEVACGAGRAMRPNTVEGAACCERAAGGESGACLPGRSRADRRVCVGTPERRRPLGRLLVGPPAGADRILFVSVWFRSGHNNAIYGELLPRLERVDRVHVFLSGREGLRGAQYRLWSGTRPLHEPLLLRAASRRYRYLLCPDPRQLPHFTGRALVNLDDPTFGDEEVMLLNRANVAAIVVTKEWAGRRLEAQGLRKPWHVISQGVSRAAVTESARAAAAARKGEAIVVGYHAGFLRTAGDRGAANSLYTVDHLLELWEQIHRRAPAARLWLLGDASRRLRARLRGRADIALFGWLPHGEMLAHIERFDVALYPRSEDRGVQAAKIIDYLASGVPVVSYDYEVTDELRTTGAGILVPGPPAFVDAVAWLVLEPAARAPLAAAARRAGARLDWDTLARDYAALLDRYLPN